MRRDDANVRAVPLDRREYNIRLADGDVLAFRADAFGIVEELHIACADGRVLAFRKVVSTLVPPLYFEEGRA